MLPSTICPAGAYALSLSSSEFTPMLQEAEKSRDDLPANSLTNSLTVALEADAVVPLPCGPSAGSQLVCCMTLVSQAPVLLACACQTAQLAVLVHWVDDPVDACILQQDQS